MSLGARTRFDVLKRDGFACHYCGARAPQARLHVDHIIPRSLGGTDDVDNLIAACLACNLGKGIDHVVEEDVACDACKKTGRGILFDFSTHATARRPVFFCGGCITVAVYYLYWSLRSKNVIAHFLSLAEAVEEVA